ncbi:MAG: hypothetical protein MJ097_00695 [Dorea sp.]|nr:hypothetical protein [Dorea sp.]
MNYPYFNYGQYPVMDNLQYMKQQQMQPVNQFQNGASQDDKIFVQGELSAQAYLVAPNSFVRLWDSTQNVFYEKRADQTGRPYMEVYEYKKRDNLTAQPVSNNSHAIDYEDKINALSKEISTLRGKIEALERKGADINDAESNTDDPAV